MTKVGVKIFYADGIVNLLPLVAVLMMVALAAPFASRINARARTVSVAALGSMAIFVAIHILYGWRSFETLGTTSDAQSRYYLMLWPAVSIAIGGGVAALADRLFCRNLMPEPLRS